MNFIKLSQPSLSPVRKRHIEEITLIITLLFSIVGIGITNYSPTEAYWYWLLMTAVLAIAGTVIAWINRASLPEPQVQKLLMMQILHWTCTAATMLGLFLLLKAGIINYEGMGLTLLLTLGLSTFLDGCWISWRFSLLGVLMGTAAILAAYIEQFFWIIILLTAMLVAFTVLWERRNNRLAAEKEEINHK